ncbi:hypothetical protein FAES_0141 [Fibrella aestuarina BUZ 2]|uniref:Uncharacterized protein n=1 Tax=Fibrella aestuarina BUZ 2 TaxID=1166018 RepID=I0K202_9BACT|nr:hypothetical protein FAES_0141 [Fibrella aestuarina BUZ 2]
MATGLPFPQRLTPFVGKSVPGAAFVWGIEPLFSPLAASS